MSKRIFLASYISNPNFLPLFVLWYFYYLTKVLTTEKQSIKDYVFLGLAFGLATQLHATAMIVLPLVTLTTLIINKYRPQLKTSGIFLSAVVFTYLPYLFYEFTHRFENFRRLFILGAKELDGTHYTSGLAAIWNFFQGTLTPFNFWYSYSIIQPNILYLIVAVFAAAALIALLYRIFISDVERVRPFMAERAQGVLIKVQYFATLLRKVGFPIEYLGALLRGTFIKRLQARDCIKISKIGLTIVLAWTFITCAVLLLFARGVHDHYIIILWPAPLIILTYAIFWMKFKFNVFASLIMLVVITSLLQIYSFYQFGHTPWSEFMPTFQSKYQNQPGVSEIGS